MVDKIIYTKELLLCKVNSESNSRATTTKFGLKSEQPKGGERIMAKKRAKKKAAKKKKATKKKAAKRKKKK